MRIRVLAFVFSADSTKKGIRVRQFFGFVLGNGQNLVIASKVSKGFEAQFCLYRNSKKSSSRKAVNIIVVLIFWGNPLNFVTPTGRLAALSRKGALDPPLKHVETVVIFPDLWSSGMGGLFPIWEGWGPEIFTAPPKTNKWLRAHVNPPKKKGMIEGPRSNESMKVTTSAICFSHAAIL